MLRSVKRFFHREPDVIIGGAERPYLLRWWVIPRNSYFNIYLHKFLRSDDDRALHDHPWASCSILLTGDYLEEVPACSREAWLAGNRATMKLPRRRFHPYFRKPEAVHRVELLPEFEKVGFDIPRNRYLYAVKSEKPVWTIFLTGPWRRSWGFWCPQGFRPWREFTAADDSGATGKGCE